MPTGYTSVLDSTADTTLKDFILGCSRAFGATIMQRDDPPGPPEEPKMSDYHSEALVRAHEDLNRYEGMTFHECCDASRIEYVKHKAQHEKSQQENKTVQARYNKMKELVGDWIPPTKDHDGLKEFMLEQLEIGFPHDFEDHYVPLGGQSWQKTKIRHAKENIEYHKNGLEKDTQNHNSRIAWIRALYESLKKETR